MPSKRPVRPAPRRRILWARAIPIFALMMLVLLGGQLLYRDRMGGEELPIWSSLIAGLAGALLINIFGTEEVAPPPVPSKTQARKAATRARQADREADEEETVSEAAPAKPTRKRRRR